MLLSFVFVLLVVSAPGPCVDSEVEFPGVQSKAVNCVSDLGSVIRKFVYNISCYFYYRERIRLKKC